MQAWGEHANCAQKGPSRLPDSIPDPRTTMPPNSMPDIYLFCCFFIAKVRNRCVYFNPTPEENLIDPSYHFCYTCV